MTDKTIDVAGWPHVRHQAWHKDRRYTEIWVSKDGHSWTMLGMETPGVAVDSPIDPRPRPVPDCTCSPRPGADARSDCPRHQGKEEPQHPAARY